MQRSTKPSTTTSQQNVKSRNEQGSDNRRTADVYSDESFIDDSLKKDEDVTDPLVEEPEEEYRPTAEADEEEAQDDVEAVEEERASGNVDAEEVEEDEREVANQ